MDILKQVEELIKQGYGRCRISKALGISDKKAYNLINQVRENNPDLPKASQSKTNASLDADEVFTSVKELHSQGLGCRKIANELGITEGSASYWIRKVEGGGKSTTMVDKIHHLLESDEFDTYDLAKRFNQSHQSINKNISKAKGEYEPVDEWIKRISKNGVKLSLLKLQLKIKTKEKAIEILENNFPGHFIAESKLENGDYLLLPIVNSKDEIDNLSIDSCKKDFNFYVSPDKNYMFVKFNDKLAGKEIKIYNFSDIHIGSKAHRLGVLKKMIDLVANDPCAFAVLGGDILEVATRNSATHPNEQYLNINGQINEAIKLFKPIAHKLLCYQWGNHEFRVEKFADADIGMVTAQLLKIPYFRVRTIIDYEFKGVNFTHSHTHYYSKGSFREDQIVNKVREILAKVNYPIHWFTSGHTHEFFQRRIYAQIKVAGKGIVNQESYVLNSGSTTADTGTYSEIWDMKPTPKDFTWIWFNTDGEYGVGHEKVCPI